MVFLLAFPMLLALRCWRFVVAGLLLLLALLARETHQKQLVFGVSRNRDEPNKNEDGLARNGTVSLLCFFNHSAYAPYFLFFREHVLEKPASSSRAVCFSMVRETSHP